MTVCAFQRHGYRDNLKNVKYIFLHLNKCMLPAICSRMALLMLLALLFCDCVSLNRRTPFLKRQKISNNIAALFLFKTKAVILSFREVTNMKTQCALDAEEMNQRDDIQQGYCMLPGT